MSSVPVFVNAGDQSITLKRRDGVECPPIYVNAPTGVREWVVARLDKVDGKATQVITWNLPESLLIQDEIKSGPKKGQAILVLKVEAEEAPGAVALRAFISSLDVRERGAVSPEVASILAEFPLPTRSVVLEVEDPFG